MNCLVGPLAFLWAKFGAWQHEMSHLGLMEVAFLRSRTEAELVSSWADHVNDTREGVDKNTEVLHGVSAQDARNAGVE